MKKPKIVCLCGSTRFKDQFAELNESNHQNNSHMNVNKYITWFVFSIAILFSAAGSCRAASATISASSVTGGGTFTISFDLYAKNTGGIKNTALYYGTPVVQVSNATLLSNSGNLLTFRANMSVPISQTVSIQLTLNGFNYSYASSSNQKTGMLYYSNGNVPTTIYNFSVNIPAIDGSILIDQSNYI